MGGWSIPYCAKEYLSVWAITNIGKLYFRENISNKNLEGTNWIRVHSPVGLVSCSCSNIGGLMAITIDGDLMLRLNTSRDNPKGTSWVIIEQPSKESNLRQISLGPMSFWGLDNQGSLYFRAGVNDERPQGKKWVDIPANLTSITVSCTNQVRKHNLYFCKKTY